MAKAKTFARGILFKLIIDSTFHGISLQRLKIVDEARLKQACFGKKAAEWEQHKAHMAAGSLALNVCGKNRHACGYAHAVMPTDVKKPTYYHNMWAFGRLGPINSI